MSHAKGAIKFEDNTIRYYDYNGTSDVVMSHHYKTLDEVKADMENEKNKTPQSFNVDIVSESKYNDGIKYVQETYCNARLNMPYLLLGDVAELIKIMTGREVTVSELESYSR